MRPVTAVIAAVALAGSIGFIGHQRYKAGYADADQSWQLRWTARDKSDAVMLVQRQGEERDEEQRRLQLAADAAKQAESEIAAARTDADAADAAAGGLRQTAAALAQRLADSQARCNTSTAKQRSAGARAALVLADVLRRVDARAGELAKEADDRRGRLREHVWGIK